MSEETFVISPPKRVVSETVPAYLSEALKKMLAIEFSARSLRANPRALCCLPISFIVAVKSTTIRRKGVFWPVARIMRSLKFMGTNLVKSCWEGNGYPSLLVRKAGKKGMENARFSVKFIY